MPARGQLKVRKISFATTGPASAKLYLTIERRGP
jgi:hypothetical protein